MSSTTFSWVAWVAWANWVQEYSIESLLTQAPYTVLYFYPKDNTPWCTVQATEFTALADQFADANTQIIGVSRDSCDSHQKFITDHWLKATYLSDPDLELLKQYWARWEKNMYGKKSMGVIRSTILTDKEWTRLKERHNVRSKGHAQKVLDVVTTSDFRI